MVRNDDDDLGTVTDIDGTVYEAKWIEFHTHSEHTIQGNSFDAEI